MSEKCVHEWYYRIVDIVSWQFFCIRCGEKLSMDKFSDRATELETIADALNARIAELEAGQRWHVVADGEMPELDQDVFAVVEGEIKVGHFYQELDFIEPDDDNTEGNIYFSVFDDSLLVATHWFPIPDGLEERER